MYTFNFYISDNSGKKHVYKIKAKDKAEAIEKGFKKAKKNAKGELNYNFECRLCITA